MQTKARCTGEMRGELLGTVRPRPNSAFCLFSYRPISVTHMLLFCVTAEVVRRRLASPQTPIFTTFYSNWNHFNMFSSFFYLQEHQTEIWETEGKLQVFPVRLLPVICWNVSHLGLEHAEDFLWMNVSLPPSWTPSCSTTTTFRRSWQRTCSAWPETWRTTLWRRRTSSSRTTRWLDLDEDHNSAAKPNECDFSLFQ